MSIGAKKVFDEALSLPVDVRVNLIEKLLTSLNLPTQPEIDKMWAEECERRIVQVDKGVVKLISGKKVFADLRKKYQR